MSHYRIVMYLGAVQALDMLCMYACTMCFEAAVFRQGAESLTRHRRILFFLIHNSLLLDARLSLRFDKLRKIIKGNLSLMPSNHRPGKDIQLHRHLGSLAVREIKAAYWHGRFNQNVLFIRCGG
jgi:hypothetical protein